MTLRAYIENLLGATHASWRMFARAREGNIAIIAAAGLVPLVGLAGAAVDYANATSARTQLQTAVDAAVLAVNKASLDPTKSTGDLRRLAMDTITGSLEGAASFALTKFEVDRAAGSVKISASASTTTSLLGAVGIDTIDFNTTAESVIGSQSLEIAMVLDNSGSMAGSKIRDLETAAKNLTNTMFTISSERVAVKMGIVPFAATVNVGSDKAREPWIDSEGLSSIHPNNIGDDTTRFDLFDAMDNITWGGCVEARPYPLDVDDTAPDAGTPDTLFVPLFAPDEPDNWRGAWNNYARDNAGLGRDGACRWGSQGGDRGRRGWWNEEDDDDRDRGRRGHNGAETGATKDAQYCRYFDPNLRERLARGSRTGPNFLCDSQPITALSTDQGVVRRGLEGMRAYGGTNIAEGIAWGWRVLSPSTPFTGGEPYDKADNRKFMIVMSDGANWHAGTSNPGMSVYSSWGYAKEGRLGRPTSSTSTLRRRMNERTLEVCTNAKRQGISVYTIAFEVSDATTLDLLQSCASSARHAFKATSGNQLIARFQEIADQISQLRLSN